MGRRNIPDRLPQDEINKFDGKGQKIYKLYQERLSILNSVDFGDLATGVTRYPSGSSNGHGGL